jgi:hypothetical protein
MKRIFFGFIFSALIVGCNEQNTKVETNVKDTVKSVNLGDTAKPAIVTNLNDEYVFIGGDTITVVLRRDIASDKKLSFVVNTKGKKFEGSANLELIEDNGKYYLPESTPRLDENTNKEYMCDSTFSYQSEKISFVFAMENKTQKRLSFIINNSTVEGIEDNFYTLYRRK